MSVAKKLLLVCICAVPCLAAPGSPNPPVSPLGDSWPTYSGDYSGKRYSTLTQINQGNAKNLTLAWVARVTGGMDAGGGGLLAPPAAPTIVGGEVAEAVVTGGLFSSAGPVSIRGAVLQVNGVLYASAPDNAWAIDARTGTVLWHYYWKTKGGTHTANKGMGIYKDWLYLETADDYLVSLEARTGKERWHKEIASFPEQYFSEAAPIVIGDHVLVGSGNDSDEPGSLRSLEPETGELQWKFHTVPMQQDEPGFDSWPSAEAARHGGGNVWVTGSYDPDTDLYIFGTGNPTPAYGSQARKGDNLFTCSLVAVHVDTGKMAWYYQTSPHDTHDWDSAQTPVLVDGQFNGKPRKLVLQATRNGHFFVLDRLTGEHLLTSRFTPWGKWVKEVNERGQPVRDSAKDASAGGTILSLDGWTNWPPPSFSPQTGLFYSRGLESYGLLYYTETDPRGATGMGGVSRGGQVSLGSAIRAIDYRTGRIVWEHPFETGQGLIGVIGTGLLSTAGKILFAADAGDNLVAFDAEHGKPLWHSRLHGVSNAPETYMLDDHQYVIVAAGDVLYAFTLY
ncbi:MAG: acido-empty-quinoprotein group A [Acidobacteriota bacterium]|nr:acido-empty-quinoprotein group A [Acidobacteriota bacterium]